MFDNEETAMFTLQMVNYEEEKSSCQIYTEIIFRKNISRNVRVRRKVKCLDVKYDVLSAN